MPPKRQFRPPKTEVGEKKYLEDCIPKDTRNATKWVQWKTWSAECGKCGVWKMLSVENTECGKCGVWKMCRKFQFSISI